MNLSLILDTATEYGLAAIVQDGTVIWQKELPEGLQNSRYLLDAVDQGFKSLRLCSSQLNYVACGVGPGSYTGIRVAAVIAKTIAFAHHLPLIGISTLWGLIPETEGSFISIIDAKIGGLYSAVGQRDKKGIIVQQAPSLLTYQEFEAATAQIHRIITPNPSLKEKLDKSFPGNHWQWIKSALSAERMAEIAEEQFQSGQFSKDGHLEILYLRKTQAEIEKEAEN